MKREQESRGGGYGDGIIHQETDAIDRHRHQQVRQNVTKAKPCCALMTELQGEAIESREEGTVLSRSVKHRGEVVHDIARIVKGQALQVERIVEAAEIGAGE